MKRTLHYLLPAILVMVAAGNLQAQTALVADQNPNYAISQAKYMKMADSINAWHGTTPQETYKAIDYLEDKRIARQERIAFRRELRLERARNGYGWGSYYNDAYYNSYGYYHPFYNSPTYYYGYRRHYNNNVAWNVLPWVVAASYWWR